MKTLSFFLFLIICLGVYSPGMAQFKNKKNLQEIPVINKEKSYPVTDYIPEVEVTYIPLETGKDILLDQGAHIYHISDKRMLIVNWRSGDVFIFDMKGKAVSHFNEKSELGYVRIDFAVYDEKNQEVFILDEICRKIVVFTDDGVYKRKLPLPPGMYSGEIYNFDDNSLLLYNEYLAGEFTQKKPYMFIDKKDGSVLSRLNIALDKVNPKVSVVDSKIGKKAQTIGLNFGNCKFGDEFIIADWSSDTIYILKKDKTLIPYFIQYPTVFSEPPVVTEVIMKTDDFIAFCIFSYDLKGAQKGNSIWGSSKNIMYDFKKGRFYKYKRWNYIAYKIDLPNNKNVSMIEAYRLIDDFKKGKLSGKIKDIAANLDINDNPVVEIIKFK